MGTAKAAVSVWEEYARVDLLARRLMTFGQIGVSPDPAAPKHGVALAARYWPPPPGA